jgi:uncharacterized delta-60 repeat protein
MNQSLQFLPSRIVSSPIRLLSISLLMGLIVFSIPHSLTWAADGDLDAMFGNGGIVTTDFSGSGANVYALAKQSDGKIIAAGYSSIGIEENHQVRIFYDFALVRYHVNGTIDNSFGTTGKVVTHFSAGLNTARAVAIQTDGKIIAAGGALAYGSSSDIAIVRYNPDGSLDASFGSGGKILLDIFGFRDFASAIALQQDGKILVAGGTSTGAATDFAVVRLHSDGSLDSSFGSGGKVITSFGPDNDYATAMKIQPGGKIVVGGTAFSNSTLNDFAVARYHIDGSLDMSFGSGGKTRTDFFSLSDLGQALAIQADGKILLSGSQYRPLFQFDFGMVRYNPDGSLDASFGSGGKVSTNVLPNSPLSGSQDIANAIAVLPTGKILVAGYVSLLFPPSMVGLARYNSNGTLDSSFGLSGLVTTTIGGSSYVEAHAVLLQSDGKVVVAGGSLQYHSDPFANRLDFTLIRYLNTGFDACIQDDSSSNLLQFNSTTGEYQFTNCSGLTVAGTGNLTRRGSAITLQHNATDRRVMVSLDTNSNRATASLQALTQGKSFSITDRNILNNACSCN